MIVLYMISPDESGREKIMNYNNNNNIVIKALYTFVKGHLMESTFTWDYSKVL